MQPLQEPTAWQLYRRLAVYLKGYWKVFTVAIVAIVPPRMMPSAVGYPQVGKDAGSRDHESYVVRGGGAGQ